MLRNQLLISSFCSLLASLAAVAAAEKAPLFEKEHRMETVFPPVGWNHPELPAGHLQALGHQRPPEGPLRVSTRTLKPVEFFEDHVLRRQPLVVRDAIGRDSPAMDSWTDEQLRRQFGHLKASVTHKRESLDEFNSLVMRLDEFLERYRKEDLYMASIVPEEMDEGFWLPPFASCGPVRRGATEAEMWLSAGGTGSLLHYHPQQQLHCMLDGRKDYIVMEPHFRESLRCVEHPPGSGAGRSELNVDMINGFSDPQVARTPWRYATLLPGDCIFVPAGFLHQVRGYGRAFSFAVMFRAGEKDKDFAECKSIGSRGASLKELPLIWTFGEDGFTRLRNRQLTPETLRELLLAEAADAAHLTFKAFSSFYAKATAAAANDAKFLAAKSAFRILARSDKKQIVTADSIRKLHSAELDKIARFLNSIHRKLRDEL